MMPTFSTVWDQTDETRKSKHLALAGIAEGTLEDLWIRKHTTGALLRMHLTRMFRFAKRAGYLGENPNPADKEWFRDMLARREHIHEPDHHRSVPYKDVYRFLEAVRAARNERSPRSLKFWGGPARQMLWLIPIKSLIIEMQMYTGVRHGEIRKARWREINWETLRWTPRRQIRRKNYFAPFRSLRKRGGS
jgi:integrase